MDSPENDTDLPCDSPDEFDASQTIVVDAEVQLDLDNECKPIDELDSAFHNNFNSINMKLPMTVQSCVPSGLQVSSELVVITNTGKQSYCIAYFLYRDITW